MAKINAAQLTQNLKTQVAAALAAADVNHDGVVGAAEMNRLPAAVKSAAAAVAAGATQLRVSQFVDSFTQAAQTEFSRVDKNHDGFLTKTDQNRLPAHLKECIAWLATGLINVPAQPADPGTTTNTTTGAFGIHGTVPASRVTVTTLLSQGLSKPTGMAVDPRDGSLWILNHGDDTSVIVDNVGTRTQKATRFQDDSAHFMNKPMQLAFSPLRNEFASAQDSNNNYSHCNDPDMQMANNFMGPTLFSADRTIYDGGSQSHLDMLHHSPFSVGIAAGRKPASTAVDKREYFVFNGQSGCIDRYYFNKPHELGGDNHLDGETYRYAPGELKRVAGVPGHLALDQSTGVLYIADTGHGRIAKLDPSQPLSSAVAIQGWHDETPLKQVPGAHISSVTAPGELSRPAGLLIHDGMLVVGDYATGHVKVFNKAGEVQGDIDLGIGANTLGGLAESPTGKLLALDMRGNRLLQVEVHA